jgi:hypothetical protein
MHINENNLGAVFVLKILYLAININAVIHNDSLINDEDIRSLSENEEVITNEFILKDKILFIVNNIIVIIIMCQYVFFVVWHIRSNLDITVIFSNIF